MIPITGLFTALLALLMIFLALQVVKLRRKKKVGLGDNGDKDVELAMRVHANFVEYVPMMLILMAVYELNGGSTLILYIIGGLMLFARTIHCIGLSKSAGITFGRFYGTLLTWLTTMFLACLLYTSPSPRDRG